MNPRQSRHGLSLLELLVVIGVILMLAAFAVPAWNGISGGINLTRSGDLVGDAIVLARQTASLRGRETRVQFLRRDDEVRGVQVMEVAQLPGGAPAPQATGRTLWLPDSVAVDETDSPLLGAAAGFEGFRFSANGRPVALDASNNYLTLRPGNRPPDNSGNFIVLQINPVTGRLQKYQP